MLFWLKKFIGFWLMPLPFCLAAMAAGLLLLRSAKRARLGRAILITAVLLLMLLSNKFVSRWLIRPLETRFPPQPEFVAGAPLPPELADCKFVVVLGGGNGATPGMSANNLLAGSSLARITEAIRILRALPEAKLIVSGPAVNNADSHATVLARTAQIYGIEAQRIIHIDHARDTEDESRAARQVAQGARVALVTSAWHMPRSVALFRSAGVDPVPCPADYTTHASEELYFGAFLWEVDSLERSSLAIRERIGYLWIWLRGKAGAQ